MDDKESDAFYAALSGKPEGKSAASQFGVAVREHLMTRKAWDEAFLSSPGSGPDAEDTERAERVLQALRVRGLLRESGSGAASPASPLRTNSTVGQWLRQWLGGWTRPVPALAVFAIAVSLFVPAYLLHQADVNQDPDLSPRSVHDLEWRVADPGATARELKDVAVARGAEAFATEINRDEWTLVLQMEDPSVQSAVRAELKQRGVTWDASTFLRIRLFRSKPTR